MYCTECECAYNGWKAKCPVCKTRLISPQPAEDQPALEANSYKDLLRAVQDSGGKICVELETTEFYRDKTWSFPYFGYGYGWTQRIAGEYDRRQISLRSRQVVKTKTIRFPYRGYGFAWTKTFHGEIAGVPICLEATKVARKKKYGFPYFGYGYAWTDRMAGTCGENLSLTLTTTKTRRTNSRSFPYKGHGFSWIARADLTIESLES